MNGNILALENYVTVTQNNSQTFSPEDFVHICKREKNYKRDFLFVNSLQGKHIHANPLEIFSLYNELVAVIKRSIDSSEKIVVIGFAETATAIGHYIAYGLPNCIYYLQTTRETIDASTPLLDFSEEHSHATQQFLYGDISKLTQCDRIIFVDDEISTGNTVLNFIDALEKLGIHSKYSVASFLNWQDDIWSHKFKEFGIDTYFVIRGILKDLGIKVPLSDTCTMPSLSPANTNQLPLVLEVSSSFNFVQERMGVRPYCLEDFSKLVYSTIGRVISNSLPTVGNHVLVLGTEEFMFVPMVFAKMLSEKLNVNVQFHATTRSPIETSSLVNYALQQRYPIASPYEAERNTYVYDLEKYDKVYIITDVFPSHKFIEDISSALVFAGCDIQNVFIITVKG